MGICGSKEDRLSRRGSRQSQNLPAHSKQTGLPVQQNAAVPEDRLNYAQMSQRPVVVHNNWATSSSPQIPPAAASASHLPMNYSAPPSTIPTSSAGFQPQQPYRPSSPGYRSASPGLQSPYQQQMQPAYGSGYNDSQYGGPQYSGGRISPQNYTQSPAMVPGRVSPQQQYGQNPAMASGLPRHMTQTSASTWASPALSSTGVPNTATASTWSDASSPNPMRQQRDSEYAGPRYGARASSKVVSQYYQFGAPIDSRKSGVLYGGDPTRSMSPQSLATVTTETSVAPLIHQTSRVEFYEEAPRLQPTASTAPRRDEEEFVAHEGSLNDDSSSREYVSDDYDEYDEYDEAEVVVVDEYTDDDKSSRTRKRASKRMSKRMSRRASVISGTGATVVGGATPPPDVSEDLGRPNKNPARFSDERLKFSGGGGVGSSPLREYTSAAAVGSPIIAKVATPTMQAVPFPSVVSTPPQTQTVPPPQRFTPPMPLPSPQRFTPPMPLPSPAPGISITKATPTLAHVTIEESVTYIQPQLRHGFSDSTMYEQDEYDRMSIPEEDEDDILNDYNDYDEYEFDEEYDVNPDWDEEDPRRKSYYGEKVEFTNEVARKGSFPTEQYTEEEEEESMDIHQRSEFGYETEQLPTEVRAPTPVQPAEVDSSKEPQTPPVAINLAVAEVRMTDSPASSVGSVRAGPPPPPPPAPAPPKLKKPTCAFCEEPVDPTSDDPMKKPVHMVGRLWHRHHSRCAECMRPIVGNLSEAVAARQAAVKSGESGSGPMRFAEIDGYLYCEEHFFVLRGQYHIKRNHKRQASIIETELRTMKQSQTVRKVRNLLNFEKNVRLQVVEGHDAGGGARRIVTSWGLEDAEVEMQKRRPMSAMRLPPTSMSEVGVSGAGADMGGRMYGTLRTDALRFKGRTMTDVPATPIQGSSKHMSVLI
ncbi:hypothetical protein BJ742DRAFT_856513 [Cladochytrium replicatum]|nr:hypothetical protein BJ742DRAFT_856513 [Cladochytrium replicatum]